MGLEIPAEVQWLSWIVGSDWPEGDETAMRRCAEAWRKAADDINELIPDLRRGVTDVLSSVEGAAADEFERYWDTFVTKDPRHLPKLAEQCEQLAERLEKGARDIEYAKYMFIALLITTATEIAALTANMVQTLGTSTAGVPAVEAAAQVTSRAILQKLLMSLADGAGRDVTVQAIQVAEGDRAGIDLRQTAPAAAPAAPAGDAPTAPAPIRALPIRTVPNPTMILCHPGANPSPASCPHRPTTEAARMAMTPPPTRLTVPPPRPPQAMVRRPPPRTAARRGRMAAAPAALSALSAPLSRRMDIRPIR